ncbi:DUF4870 domain-containing protein [Ascidiimonas aurantiaca]|uniref:DUF4870 domain-containing protein n=1 Tax=Ascidiimonas aurantiaca TaxID=1685432 RepID=UPI0030EC7A21
MESSITQNHKTLATITHLSTFSKYFIPFGNFIVPLVLWISKKEESEYMDHHGKQALNFQISILLYSICIGLLSIPFFIFFAHDFIGFANLLDHNTHDVHFDFSSLFEFRRGLPFLGLAAAFALVIFALDVICSIVAALKAGEGVWYRYPLTINFIK